MGEPPLPPDLETFGDPDRWELLSWSRSAALGRTEYTKAMFVGHGCLVHHFIEVDVPGPAVEITMSVSFCLGAIIVKDVDEQGELIGRSLHSWRSAGVRDRSFF